MTVGVEDAEVGKSQSSHHRSLLHLSIDLPNFSPFLEKWLGPSVTNGRRRRSNPMPLDFRGDKLEEKLGSRRTLMMYTNSSPKKCADQRLPFV